MLCTTNESPAEFSEMVSFRRGFPPGALSLAKKLQLPETVSCDELSSTVRRVMEYLTASHGLLDLEEAEVRERQHIRLEVEEHRAVLQSAMYDGEKRRLGGGRVKVDWRRDLAEAALDKFDRKVMCGETLFKEMLSKQQHLSTTKHAELSQDSSCEEEDAPQEDGNEP